MPSGELDHLKFRANYAEAMIGALFFEGKIDYNYTPDDPEFINNCVDKYLKLQGIKK